MSLRRQGTASSQRTARPPHPLCSAQARKTAGPAPGAVRGGTRHTPTAVGGTGAGSLHEGVAAFELHAIAGARGQASSASEGLLAHTHTSAAVARDG